MNTADAAASPSSSLTEAEWPRLALGPQKQFRVRGAVANRPGDSGEAASGGKVDVGKLSSLRVRFPKNTEKQSQPNVY